MDMFDSVELGSVYEWKGCLIQWNQVVYEMAMIELLELGIVQSQFSESQFFEVLFLQSPCAVVKVVCVGYWIQLKCIFLGALRSFRHDCTSF